MTDVISPFDAPPGDPVVVSRDAWREARIRLLALEKEATHARDRALRALRELPFELVETDYRFLGPEGEVGLIDLFEGRRQLFVHHMMWLDSDEACPSCSMFYDSLGRPEHFAAADTSVQFVAKAPFASIERMRERLGWERPIYATVGTAFSDDFQATIDPARGVTEYNWAPFGVGGDTAFDMPVQSTFLRDGDRVLHKYSACARGTELTQNYHALLDVTPLGRQDARGWVRHRDRYGAEHSHRHHH
ncbi:DUF899 family protein [Schumannella soli]|uniref:DUF899 family protein n=1 Tax=Schumannella soli TaxID=2590779 RepID=UPI0015E83A86|nr:DUF899 family protein [Schumannella soli]